MLKTAPFAAYTASKLCIPNELLNNMMAGNFAANKKVQIQEMGGPWIVCLKVFSRES